MILNKNTLPQCFYKMIIKRLRLDKTSLWKKYHSLNRKRFKLVRKESKSFINFGKNTKEISNSHLSNNKREVKIKSAEKWLIELCSLHANKNYLICVKRSRNCVAVAIRNQLEEIETKFKESCKNKEKIKNLRKQMLNRNKKC